MSNQRNPKSFLFFIVLNFVAWVIFYTFMEPVAAWFLYGQYHDTPFSNVISRIGENIRLLPMGIAMLAYNCFFPLSFYSWIFYALLVASYLIYRFEWTNRSIK